MPKRRRRRRHTNRRGQYLLAFGIVQLALGATYAAPATTPGRQLVQQLLPPAVYLVLSLAAGGVAIAAAFLRSPVLQRAAFALLAGASAARCLANLAGFVVHQEPPLVTGVLAFGLLVRVHVLVAGWPEPVGAPVALTQAQLEALADELRRRGCR